MNYFTTSQAVYEQAKQTHEQYNSQFALMTKIDNTELAIAVLSGLIGSFMDMFCLSNVNNLSKEHVIGFKPESEIRHLSNSGWINKHVDTVLSKFHQGSFAKWLEWKCKVPFDKVAKTGVLGITPENHRLLSLGHDPILGLYYGTKDILNGEFTVCDNSATVYNLQNAHGQQVNLFLAFMKEIGHLLSDIGTKTSLPFPGLWLMCKQEGVSPVNDLTWTMLANGLYRKGFTVNHLLSCSVPMIFANLTLLVSELVYSLILRKRGGFSPLDDRQIFFHRTKIMRTIAYAIMTTSNIAKVVISHGNFFAVNMALYPELLRGSYDLIKDCYRMEDKRHEFVMSQLNEKFNLNQARFDKLLNYGK